MNLKLPSARMFKAGAFLAAAAAVAYLPSLRAGFIWDDGSFLTENPLIKAADGLRRFWFTAEAPDYWPVTSSTLWLEWRLWGMHALGYHATNLALHVAESLLLWAVLRRLAVPGAFLAALLFAVHPVNVESVAWITQRKNLMAMLFYLGSIWFFLKDDLGAEPAKRWYWWSLAAFTLAMLSKASVVVLPVVLLGLILWRRRPTRLDAIRLAPFFLVGGGLALVNLWFQSRHLPGAIRTAGALERLLGAGAVVWFYLSKALVPVRLMFLYPQWHIRADDPRWWLPLLAAIGLTTVFWRHRRSWGRPWLFAWGYFCAALVPVMGFTDITFMQFSLVADHYQHLAIIAVVTMAGAGWMRWSRAGKAAVLAGNRNFFNFAPVLAAAVAVGGLTALTWKQCLIYRDAKTLYLATIEANPDAWLAHNNLGLMLYESGNIPEARSHLDAALRLNPNSAEAQNNLGMLLAGSGHDAEAIARYKTALRLRPDYAEAHNNLGNEWRKEGRISEAIAEYEQALQSGPGRAGMQNNLGLALFDLGRFPEAIAHYEQALRLTPDYPEAWLNLGDTLRKAGRLPEAIAAYEHALRLRPESAEGESGLGVSLAAAGRLAEGTVHLEAAVRLNPNEAEARYDLGLALAHGGKVAEAIVQLEEAVRLQPNHAEAQNNLGVALAQVGRRSEAIAHLEAAVRLKPDDVEARENLRAALGPSEPSPK